MLHVNLHPFPVLQTPRLTLRAVTFDDAEALFRMRTDVEVLKYIDICPPKTVEGVLEWIKMIHQNHEKNDAIMWAICLQGSTELIGTICFWRIDKANHRAEIGYMLATPHHGNGIMQEALKEALKYVFTNINMHSVEANVHPSNQPSIKLLERNGFVREGYFKENYYSNGKFTDSAIYSLITTKK